MPAPSFSQRAASPGRLSSRSVLGVLFGVVLGALGTAAVTAVTIIAISLTGAALSTGKPLVEDAEGMAFLLSFGTVAAVLIGAAGGGIGAASSTTKRAIGMGALVGALIGAVVNVVSGIQSRDLSTILGASVFALFGALTGAIGGAIGRAENRALERAGAGCVIPVAVVAGLFLVWILFSTCGGIIPWPLTRR